MSAPTATGREASTLSSLRALLDVAAVVRSHDDLTRLLEATAATIAQELGFGAVVVNLSRPAWDDYEVVVVEDRDEPGSSSTRPVTAVSCRSPASASTSSRGSAASPPPPSSG